MMKVMSRSGNPAARAAGAGTTAHRLAAVQIIAIVEAILVETIVVGAIVLACAMVLPASGFQFDRNVM
jgi:hypothetical protein